MSVNEAAADTKPYPIDSEDVSILETLFRISKSMRGLMGIHLAELGLHPGQDEMIVAISAGDPLAVNAIADVICVRPSTVSKMIDRLSEKGFVERQRDPTDSRKTAISITPLGLELKSKVLVIHERFEQEFASAFSENGASRISGALAKTESILRRRLSRLR